MEALVRPLAWSEWPKSAQNIFQVMRSETGEKLVLKQNIFIKKILPASILRRLTKKEIAAYSKPYIKPGEDRRPMLTWPREIPLDGEPSDIAAIASSYSSWLKTCPVPKLFINAEPGSILVGAQREFCRSWLNQKEVTVRGKHFIQEDSPDKIAQS